jgi:hypothetical protein
MKRCAVFRSDRSEHGGGGEGGAREDDGAAMGDADEEAEDEAEAVEEGGRTAENVGGGEGHAVADRVGVVDHVAGGVNLV